MKGGLITPSTMGPPGIGCPAIFSLSRVSLAVIVTEPTLSGIHGLERVIGVCHHFAVPVIVCINKYDITQDNSRQIEDYCQGQGIVMGNFPDKTLCKLRITTGDYDGN